MLSDCWLCGMPLWRHLKAFKSNEWAQYGLTWGWNWGCGEEEMQSWAWGVCERGDRGGVSGDCHVEARRTPKLIYYFNSRSKCLPFVCSCFTISAECRSYKWCVIASHRAPAPISYYAQAWCRKSLFECCSYWHFGICLAGRREEETRKGMGAFDFYQAFVWHHHLTQFPCCCWTNLVSEHKFMCMQDEG